MNRVASAPTPGCAEREGVRAWLPRGLVCRLVLVLAALALLGSGAGELLPRQAGAAPAASQTGRTADGPSRTEGSTPVRALLVRGVLLSPVPGPTGAGAGLPTGAAPLSPPRLVTTDEAVAEAAPLHAAAPGAPGSRAPPGVAGT